MSAREHCLSIIDRERGRLLVRAQELKRSTDLTDAESLMREAPLLNMLAYLRSCVLQEVRDDG